jgi:antitoxin StbD
VIADIQPASLADSRANQPRSGDGRELQLLDVLGSDRADWVSVHGHCRRRECVHVGATLVGVVGKPHEVLATREARAALPAMLERFRQDGADAEPVVIGARRRPEAVVLSYERYLRLAGGRERVAAALARQVGEAGAVLLDDDAALGLADSELHAMRAERRASRS